jgi:Ni2+-binding GTPase involved in maturation of urease and hydrogenase
MVIDNRQSQGVPDDVMVELGYPVGAGKGLYESATYTCSHCHSVVVIEPKRTRERGFCRGCSRQICDGCNAIKAKTFECHSMAQIIEETLEAAVRQSDSGSSILLP